MNTKRNIKDYIIRLEIVTLTKREKVVLGGIHSRQVSVTVKNLLQVNQFSESSTSINE